MSRSSSGIFAALRSASRLRFAAGLALATGLALAAADDAAATTIQATATTVTGSPLQVKLTIDDATAPGDLVVTLAVTGPGATVADLRGFFAHVANESLLPGLTVSGANVTGSSFLANAVTQVGSGNTMAGAGASVPFDLGIALGTPGIGYDDLRQVTFTLSHATASLDASFFTGQKFGVRATSVGKSRCRTGSSKLIGLVPVPEPGTALLMGLGLAGLASIRRR